MAKLLFHVAIISLMVAGCIGPRNMPIEWTKSSNRQLMDIFYGTYPPDELHWQRVKRVWDSQLPQYKEVPVERLRNHVRELRNYYLNKWQNRSMSEREKVDDSLARIYKNTNSSLPHHEMRMLDILIKNFPHYAEELELIRTVVYRWYELYAPIGKEIPTKYVDWTPQRIANLLHIHKQVRRGEGDLPRRVKERWLKMHEHLNVSDDSLLRILYKVKNKDKYEPNEEEKLEADRRYKSLFSPEVNGVQEEGSAHKGIKMKWNDQMNTDVLHIDDMIRHLEGNLAPAMKNRWDGMRPEARHLTGFYLMNRASHLRKIPYEPKLEHLQDSKKKYDALPPIPREVLSRGRGKWRKRKLKVCEGEEPNQQHEDQPASRSLKIPLKNLELLQQNQAGIYSSYAIHAPCPNKTYYYGSSSHTPIDQGPFGSLPNIPHSHQDFQNQAGSSSHIPIHQDSFSLLPAFQYPHQNFWSPGGSSSHTSIHEDPSGFVTVTPRPQSIQPNRRDSSKRTSVPSDSFGSLPNIPQPYHNSSGSDGSGSYISINEDPSGLIVVTSRPHHQQDHRGSSSRTSVHPGPSHSQLDTPRPNPYQSIPGRDSRH